MGLSGAHCECSTLRGLSRISLKVSSHEHLYHTGGRYTTWLATHPAWSLPVDPYLSPILTHRGERTSILMCKRPGCRPTEVRARVPPPADGSGPATVRGRPEPRFGMHRGGAKASIPPRSPTGDIGTERVKIILLRLVKPSKYRAKSRLPRRRNPRAR